MPRAGQGLLAHRSTNQNGPIKLHDHDSCVADGRDTDDDQLQRVPAGTGVNDSAARLLSRAYDAGVEGSAEHITGLTARPLKQAPTDAATAAVSSGACNPGKAIASDRPSAEAATLLGVAAAEAAPAVTNATASCLRNGTMAGDKAPAQVLQTHPAAITPDLRHLPDSVINSARLHAAPAAASTGMQAGKNVQRPDATHPAHASEMDGMHAEPAVRSAEGNAASGPDHRSSAASPRANLRTAVALQAHSVIGGSQPPGKESQPSGGVRVNAELLRLRSLYFSGGPGTGRAVPALSRGSSQEARDLALASRLQQEECRRAGPALPGRAPQV